MVYVPASIWMVTFLPVTAKARLLVMPPAVTSSVPPSKMVVPEVAPRLDYRHC
jgi:hypothetical protein